MLKFEVEHKPEPKGSMKGFVTRPKPGSGKTPRAVVVDDNRDTLLVWMDRVRQAAREAMGGQPLLMGPLALSVWFEFARPKKHFYETRARKGQLRDDAPACHDKKPDMDKLIRAVKDALTRTVWVDDCQVCQYGFMEKRWSCDGRDRALILIEEIE